MTSWNNWSLDELVSQYEKLTSQLANPNLPTELRDGFARILHNIEREFDIRGVELDIA